MARPDVLAEFRAARLAKLAEVAQKSGYSPRAVNWISGAISFVSCYRRKGAQTWHVSGAELCRLLVADLEPRHPGHVRMMLESLGIQSSVDVGRIVYALIDAGCCTQSESDSRGDFDGVFERERIEEFIRSKGLDRQRDVPALVKMLVVSAFYAVGALFLVIGTGRALDHDSYWIGMSAIIAGWLISRSSYGRRMRFGMPWADLEPRTRPLPDERQADAE